MGDKYGNKSYQVYFSLGQDKVVTVRYQCIPGKKANI